MPIGNKFRFEFRFFWFSCSVWPMPILGICETLSDINLECVGASISQFGPLDLD